jgi:hypothetical protein
MGVGAPPPPALPAAPSLLRKGWGAQQKNGAITYPLFLSASKKEKKKSKNKFCTSYKELINISKEIQILCTHSKCFKASYL